MLLRNCSPSRLLILASAVSVGFPTFMTVHSPIATAIQSETPDEDEQSEKARTKKEKPEPQPNFADESRAKSFKEAVALFADEKWKAAEKLFKACQKGESKDVRRDLKSWLSACKAGPMLEPIDKAINKSKWKLAWQKIEKVRHKYGGTPLKEKIGDLRAAIEKELFLVLATYEEDAPQPERNAGPRPANAKINTDPKFVTEGKRSLHWKPGKSALGGGGNPGVWFPRVPIAQIDGKTLEKYPYLHISIYGREKDAGRFTLFLDTGDRLNSNPLAARSFYKHHMMTKPGWHHLRFDVRKDFASYTSPKMEDVESLSIIVIPPANTKAIYIDDVKLEKK